MYQQNSQENNAFYIKLAKDEFKILFDLYKTYRSKSILYSADVLNSLNFHIEKAFILLSPVNPKIFILQKGKPG